MSEKYKTLVMKAEDGIYQIDENLIIRFANPCLLRMLGYPEAELIGRKFTDIVRSSERAKVFKKFENRKRRLVEHYELSLRRADGSSFPAGRTLRRRYHHQHNQKNSLPARPARINYNLPYIINMIVHRSIK